MDMLELGEVLDRENIRDLVNQYCNAIVQRDVEAVVALFADDGEFAAEAAAFKGSEVPTSSKEAVQRVSGKPALRTMYELALPALEPLPCSNNHVIELLGATTARGRSVSQIHSALKPQTLSIALYDDEYIKEASGWKFKRRLVQLRRLVE